MKPCITFLFFLLALCGGVSQPAFAQRPAVSGQVVDPQRGPVAFAAVALLAAADSGLVRSGRADERGEYRFEAVPAGAYRVAAMGTGFGQGRSEAFRVEAGGVRVPDLQLKAVAQALGEVAVVGRKPLLETQGGSLGGRAGCAASGPIRWPWPKPTGGPWRASTGLR